MKSVFKAFKFKIDDEEGEQLNNLSLSSFCFYERFFLEKTSFNSTKEVQLRIDLGKSF